MTGTAEAARAMTSCAVRDCQREGVFALTRKLPEAGAGFPRVVLLSYCADHYGQANAFHDRRPLQTNA